MHFEIGFSRLSDLLVIPTVDVIVDPDGALLIEGSEIDLPQPRVRDDPDPRLLGQRTDRVHAAVERGREDDIDSGAGELFRKPEGFLFPKIGQSVSVARVIDLSDVLFGFPMPDEQQLRDLTEVPARLIELPDRSDAHVPQLAFVSPDGHRGAPIAIP